MFSDARRYGKTIMFVKNVNNESETEDSDSDTDDENIESENDEEDEETSQPFKKQKLNNS